MDSGTNILALSNPLTGRGSMSNTSLVYFNCQRLSMVIRSFWASLKRRERATSEKHPKLAIEPVLTDLRQRLQSISKDNKKKKFLDSFTGIHTKWHMVEMNSGT